MSIFGGKRKDDAFGAPDGAAGATPAHRPLPGSAPRSGERTITTAAQGGNQKMANIGKSISIKGDLTGNEDIVIEGQVDGKVDLPNGQLTVGANGRVKGEVHAKAVVVIGRVAGNVNGSERVEIQATGVVEGDVLAPRLVVAEGAIVNGAIKMGGREGAAASPSRQAPPPDARKMGAATPPA